MIMGYGEFKNRKISGVVVDLVPFSSEYFERVVELRNREDNRYFLNQSYLLSVNEQELWYRGYLERDNDIYWCIVDKSGRFLGTIRVYDINGEEGELGSLIVDERFSKEAPYALEAQLRVIDFCFRELSIKKIVNQDRVDNRVMNSLTKKLGYRFIKKVDIRGIEYNYYVLKEEDFKRDKLVNIIEYWIKR